MLEQFESDLLIVITYRMIWGHCTKVKYLPCRSSNGPYDRFFSCPFCKQMVPYLSSDRVYVSDIEMWHEHKLCPRLRLASYG